MSWILIALINPATHGFANIFDNYLTNKLVKNPWTLTFYGAIFNLLLLPCVWLIQTPGWLPMNLWLACALIALIELCYLYPYYRALQQDDTSIVCALFDLGKIFVPVFAFLLVGEQLSWFQYLGFGLLILSSLLISLDRRKQLRLNSAFWWMVLCSLLLALEAVLYKYLFIHVSWSTGFVWPSVLTSILSLLFLLIPKQRRSIVQQFHKLKSIAPVFIGGSLLTFIGSMASTYAIGLVPVTLEKSVDAFQPFFVLLYAILFKRRYPKFFKERIDARSVIRKCLFFIVMLLGILMVVWRKGS